MDSNTTQLIIASSGILTTVSAWILGGRKKAKIDSLTIVSDGADKLVDSTLKLVDRLEQYLSEEKQHTNKCEERLKIQDDKIQELQDIVKNAKN
jgi:ornithine cyclodeaminase/alanine dehydrogenase-like protein (mu-crystallin family)